MKCKHNFIYRQYRELKTSDDVSFLTKRRNEKLKDHNPDECKYDNCIECSYVDSRLISIDKKWNELTKEEKNQFKDRKFGKCSGDCPNQNIKIVLTNQSFSICTEDKCFVLTTFISITEDDPVIKEIASKLKIDVEDILDILNTTKKFIK